eukprot:scaffold148313_cov32-Attheya_sp.AAC.1
MEFRRRPSSWSIRTFLTVAIGLFVVWMTLLNVGVLHPETFFVTKDQHSNNEHHDGNNGDARHFFTHPRKRRRKKGRLHRNGLGNPPLPETNQHQTAPKDTNEKHDGSHHWKKKQIETGVDRSNTDTQIVDPPPGVTEKTPRRAEDPNNDQARSILLEEETTNKENHDVNIDDDDTSKKKKKRPNILFLYADDWRHDTLGCAGNPVVQTPYLDALAADGIRFTHNMVTTS